MSHDNVKCDMIMSHMVKYEIDDSELWGSHTAQEQVFALNDSVMSRINEL